MSSENCRFFNLPSVQEAFYTNKQSGDFVKIDDIIYRVICDEGIICTPNLLTALQLTGMGRKQLYFEALVWTNLMAQFDQKARRITLFSSA